MTQYRRAYIPGGSFFFTVVTNNRKSIFKSAISREILREAWLTIHEKYPFTLIACCLLPDHLHCIWTMPENDSDYSLRWRGIKGLFSKEYNKVIKPAIKLSNDDSGNIYTLDPKEIRIRVFNPRGILIESFGFKGQGPGEFRGPAWLKITPKEELVVYDVLNRRFTYLALDGTTVKTLNAKTVPFGKNDIDSKGNVYIHKLGRGLEGHEDLIKLNSSFIHTNTFFSFQKKRTPRRVFNPFPIAYYFTVTQSDKLIWFLSSSYIIHVVDPNSREVMRIIKKHVPIKLTKQDKELLIKTEYSKQQDVFQLEFEFPQYYPVASGVITDDQERIYIRTYEKDDQGSIFYDVFSPEGRYILRFSINEMEEVEVVKDNRLYCKTVSNADGVPLVTRYKLDCKYSGFKVEK